MDEEEGEDAVDGAIDKVANGQAYLNIDKKYAIYFNTDQNKTQGLCPLYSKIIINHVSNIRIG